MEKESLKIKTYEKGVSKLPDYPSDEGYTAEMLKAVFDSRSDKEIKEKHNALCDATAEISEELKTYGEKIDETSSGLEQHVGSEEAHSALFGAMREELAGANSGLEQHMSSQEAHAALFETIREELAKKAEEESATNLENGDGEVSLKQTAWKDEAANSATGKGAVALGGYNKANGKCSMAVNYNNEVNAPNAFAANSANKIPEEAEGSFVSGHCNEAKSIFQTIVGTYSDVEADDSFVVGNGGSETDRRNAFKVDKHGNAKVSGSIDATGDITASGNVEATRVNCTGVNAKNVSVTNNLSVTNKVGCEELAVNARTVAGSGSISEHHISYGKNTVSGRGSAAFGGNNKVYGETSFAAITSNTIPEGLTHVFIAGHANTATASHQAIFGNYAAPETADAFVIGNGTSAGRKNAFAVEKNGNIKVGGTQITLGNTVITEEDTKTLKTPEKTIVKHTNQEYKLTSYTAEEMKLPISTGVFQSALLECLSYENMLLARIEALETRLAGESE